jgi:hypothetical protein
VEREILMNTVGDLFIMADIFERCKRVPEERKIALGELREEWIELSRQLQWEHRGEIPEELPPDFNVDSVTVLSPERFEKERDRLLALCKR